MNRLLPPDHPDAPKYWMHETTGDLAEAMKAYLAHEIMTRHQIRLAKAYLWQWVRSPVWPPSGVLETLRLRVASIDTQADLTRAIHAAIEMGMDPL